MPLVGVVLGDLANPVLTIGRLPRCLTRNIAREYSARDVHIPSHELIHEDQDGFARFLKNKNSFFTCFQGGFSSRDVDIMAMAQALRMRCYCHKRNIDNKRCPHGC